MRSLQARDFLSMSKEELLSLPDEQFVLVFDDGELVTNTRRTIYSAFHWEVNRRYPQTPLTKACHVGSGVGPTPDTSQDILSVLVRLVHETYGDASYDREELWKLIYEIQNEIYNTFIIHCEEHMTTTDILDYLELFDHPEITKANQEVRPNQRSLDKTYEIISGVMRNSDDVAHNPVAIAVRTKLVKIDQVNQMVGPRGYLTDVDSNIFQTPVLRGYFEGIYSLHDSMIESRSAAKALTFTKKPLRQVEYFNRKMQLVTSNVSALIMGDCGTKYYSTIPVDKKLLKCMEGKYYINDDKKLVAIREGDNHLIGKTLKVRTAFNCAYRGRGSVCACCFGEIAYSVPHGTNLGHVSSTEMCQEGSQLVMSVKHYDGSSKVVDIDISEADAIYIKEGSRVSTLALNQSLKDKNAYLLMVPNGKGIEGAQGLTAITPTVDVNLLPVQRTTSFRDVIFGTVDKDGNVLEEYVTVSVGTRHGSLSREFLNYIQEVGYTITETGMYKVELADWDFEKEAFVLPMRHLSMLDVMSEIEVFIRSPRESGGEKKTNAKKTKTTLVGTTKKLIDYTNFDEALLDLTEMVTARLSVNIAHLEVIMLSMLRSASDPYNYRIPEIDEPAMFESHSTLMERRSHGGTMAFERQPQVFEDVDSYLITDRPSHILDEMIID